MSPNPTSPLQLVFLWHMHQPDYRDAFSGQPTLPWVRLHGTRGYLDMAWTLWRHPEVKATVNFVPVLIDQLQAFVDGGERDLHWHLTKKPARLLTPQDAEFLLKHFFSVNHESCIRPRSRYWHLLQKRGLEGPFRPASDFTEAELRDLQVLFNLSWFGFAARRELPFLEQLEQKGRNFSEDDKKRLLDLQLAAVRRVLPLWRALSERGQVELTTTPYFHPILPLVVDSDCAVQSMPKAPLPPRFAWPDDAREQVERAVRRHTEVFGAPPTGVWPAEGSVSDEVISILAAAGLKHFTTDEAQLFRSLGPTSRDALYQPWRVQIGDTVDGPPGGRPTDPGEAPSPRAAMVAFFRDHELSDLLGFTYARNPAPVAVDDLLSRLDAIAARQPAGRPATVSIVLDGENPWEAYPDSGRSFLETLYTRLTGHPSIQTALPRELVEAMPADAPTLRHIHAGSWIGGDFNIWIGHTVENTAWKLLGETRAFHEKVARGQGATPEVLAQSYEHLLRAEGSDWFWWYGDTFSSNNDADFDHLFRAHLRKIYTLLGAPVPAALNQSLYPSAPAVPSKPPRSFVSPNFQGESTYFDWLGAGTLELGGGSASMYRSSNHFARLRYGFDLDHLFLRLDPPEGGDRMSLDGLTLHIDVTGAEHIQAEIALGAAASGELYRIGPDLQRYEESPLRLLKLRHGVLEVGLPFRALRAVAGDRVNVTLHLLRDRVELDRYPGGRPLALQVPDESFEDENWSV